MFAAIWKKIKDYGGLIDDIIHDFAGDLKSFRVQLVYMSYVFNLLVLYGVLFRGLDWKALTISFGTQTVVYAFYFKSKEQQAKMENAAPDTADADPKTERDPDAN